MPEFTLIQKILLWSIPILFAITFHEAAHGFVANKLGDNTAKRAGRITLNPFKHIDLMGTIVIPITLYITTHFIFGWAKPVPVVAENLRKPKRDMALVALAGPLSNFLMALFWMLVVKLGVYLIEDKTFAGYPIAFMGQAGVLVNLILMVLNLIPIPPLDGSRLITYLLPSPWDKRFNALNPLVGILIVVLLISTGILNQILEPAINVLLEGLRTLFSV